MAQEWPLADHTEIFGEITLVDETPSPRPECVTATAATTATTTQAVPGRHCVPSEIAMFDIGYFHPSTPPG